MSYENLLEHPILRLEELDFLIRCAQEKCLCSQFISRNCGPCMARQKIVECHMRLVWKICQEFERKSKFKAEELMADGIIGLNEAIIEFDPDNNKKGFFKFAENRVRWKIIASDLLKPLIPIPKSAQRKINKILKKIDEYEIKNTPVPFFEICEELKISKVQLVQLLDIIKTREHERFIEIEIESGLISNNDIKEHYPQEFDWMYEADLKLGLEILTDYQKKIITHYYGVGVEVKSLERLSKEFKQSYEKTRLDFNFAMDKLKRFYEKDIEKDEDE